LVKILPRLASSAPFLCLIVCHLECPDIKKRKEYHARRPAFKAVIPTPYKKLKLEIETRRLDRQIGKTPFHNRRLMRHRLSTAAGIVFCVALCVCVTTAQQFPNQQAQDFEAGRAPTAPEVAGFEKDLAAKPGDLHLTRKLGKAYFFQFFGDGIKAAIPKAKATLEKALEIGKDDPETLAYLGALYVLEGQRVFEKDPVRQKAGYDRGFELVKKAEALGPRNGAVLSVATATYIYLPDSYGMAPHVVELLEGMINAMGPYFQKFSHHGQQRLLLTLGQAYVRTNQPEKARVKFEEALKVNGSSDEAILIKKEMRRLTPVAEKAH
jgi:tetratricopeptide (TPR) repeat protein